MRNFITIWLGQLVSTFGSRMTSFATTIWAWEITGQATALALVNFFTLLPSIVITLFAGAIVDRWNRKLLMIVGDTVAVFSTIAILALYLTHSLQIWHLYVLGAFNGAFGEIQELAYTASLSQLVPPQQYTRASSMNSTLHYGSIIIAPALAGTLYYIVGLAGIGLIDIVTFSVAIATVLLVPIPQSPFPTTEHYKDISIWQQLTFGFHYIIKRPDLLALVVSASLFWFAHDLGGSVATPMILARTENDSRVLGSIFSIAGIGGVTGAVLLSVWGGSRRRIHGYLLGMVGAGVSKAVFGFGQSLQIWLPAQFCSSLNFPLLESSQTAILLAKVAPEVQGRVFAARSLMFQIVSAVASLIAGPLADDVFEPAMRSGGGLAKLLGGVFGTQPGAGMAVMYVTTSTCLLLVGLGGYACRPLRDLDE
jgi:MFS transporter, DHA3 family, macrolide efflux protein